MQDTVKVKAPATSANIGPGFDCLGMALDIWNEVHVSLGPPSFTITGEGEKTLHLGQKNLVYKSFCLPFRESGQSVPDVSMSCHNAIPLGRGLGSSSAAIVAGLLAGNALCERPLSQEQLLQLAVQVEGHPDNVAATLLGGCQVVVSDEDRLITASVPLPPELKAVIYIPDFPMPTERARQLLPDQVSREDAVYNMGRVALLIRAFATGDFSQLAVATMDRLHQPARQTIFPAMKNIFRAALGAGALGVFLSGAGSSVLALTTGREFTIGYEMADAAVKSGLDGALKITTPTISGAHEFDSD